MKIRIGELIDETAKRDAVHVAIYPMIATKVMKPGERTANGVVDPFLKKDVQPGERYYLWLFPETVTDIRHTWTHPHFPQE